MTHDVGENFFEKPFEYRTDDTQHVAKINFGVGTINDSTAVK